MSGRTFLRGLVAALGRDTPAFGGTRRPGCDCCNLSQHASPELLAALDAVLVDKVGRSSADEILVALDVALDREEEQ